MRMDQSNAHLKFAHLRDKLELGRTVFSKVANLSKIALETPR